MLLRLPDGGADGFRCLRAAHDCEKLAQGILPYDTCSCGKVYATREDWEELKLVGFTGAIKAGERDTVELRLCSACMSTRGVEVTP